MLLNSFFIRSGKKNQKIVGEITLVLAMPTELWNMDILSYPLDETFLVSILLSFWSNDVCQLILPFTTLIAVIYWFKTSLKVNINRNCNKWGRNRNLVNFWVSHLIFVIVDDFQLTLTVTVFINCFFQPHLLIISKLERTALFVKETIWQPEGLTWSLLWLDS